MHPNIGIACDTAVVWLPAFVCFCAAAVNLGGVLTEDSFAFSNLRAAEGISTIRALLRRIRLNRAQP
jgi:hypothetical protein